MKVVFQSIVSIIALKSPSLAAAETLRSLQEKSSDYDAALRAYHKTINIFNTMGNLSVTSGDGIDTTGKILEEQLMNIAPEIGVIGISIQVLDIELLLMETPIAIRMTSYLGAIWWNCVAVYSYDYNDALTKIRPEIVATDSSMFNSKSRVDCIAQATASYSSLSMPNVVSNLISTLGQYDIIVEASTGDDVIACEDIGCLRSIAIESEFDPGVMGKIVAKLAYDISLEDGWNQFGAKQCTGNCRPYADTTGYRERNGRDSWRPTLQDDGRGYFSRGEHVTPHIGKTASFRYLPESDRNSRIAPKPGYSKKRKKEAKKVFKLMATLDDTAKIEIEQFNDKILVVGALIDAFVAKTIVEGYQDADLSSSGNVLSLERFVHFIQALTAVDHDAVVIAWKEKVKHDLIRPTTVIKDWDQKRITTWTLEGVKEIESRDFEAYVRVMPHSEYVSGSACIFQAQAELIDSYLTHMDLEAGSFQIVFPLVETGNSTVQPGTVPASQVQLAFSNIQEMNKAGGSSRLNGGMHFRKSVDEAKTLCSGISASTLDGSLQLYLPSTPSPSALRSDEDETCCPPRKRWMPYNKCTQYYQCSRGVVAGIIHTCPPGTLWDVRFSTCNWISSGTTCMDQDPCGI